MRQIKLITLTAAIAALTGCLEGGSSTDAVASRITTSPAITTSGTPTVSATPPVSSTPVALNVLDISTYNGRFQALENANYHITFDVGAMTFSGVINGRCRQASFDMNCVQVFQGQLMTNAANDGYGNGLITLRFIDTVSHANYNSGGVPSVSNANYNYYFTQVSANCFKANGGGWGMFGMIDATSLTLNPNFFTFCRN